MPDATLNLELCAPEKPHLELEVAEVMIPGAAGVFTVHPEHTPFLTTITPGVLIATTASGDEQFFAVHGGFAEVTSGKVIVLADYYEAIDDINLERAESAAARAQALLQKPPENMDWKRAELALARAMARMHATNKRGYV